MSLLDKAHIAVRDPVLAAYTLWSRLHSASLFAVYRARSRRAGLDRLHFVLSFDCDTAEDAAAAGEVHEKLMALGVCAAYAVPGELLVESAPTYRRIAETGAEFLNHGHRRHTYFDAARGEYRSCFFYDQQPLETVEADIVAGDRALRDVIGANPLGFRTPHFGTFQRPAQLRFLHAVLHRLGYAFSSSTTPLFAFRHGPAFRQLGLTELPVSGRADEPLSILDSWGCFAAPDRVLTPRDYHDGAIGLAKYLQGGPGILNYYADPSHVADQPIFFETIAELRRYALPTTFRQLMARL